MAALGPVADALARVRCRQIDRRFTEQAVLDVADRERTNALPWRGQFTPGLPATLIRALAPTGAVLDPFAGSGTTLAEAARAGLESIGGEVNPAALSLARVYELAAITPRERRAALDRCEALLTGVGLRVAGASGGVISGVAVASALERVGDDPAAALGTAALMLGMGNTARLTSTQLLRGWVQVRRLTESLPENSVDARVLAADARDLPLAGASVGMVLTSPPYINVFNYHQNYRPAMELLGWDVLPAARTEIGANRKHRGNRFLTVIQYCLDMARAVDEMARVARLDAPIVVVVGRESRVRGVAFPNGDIIACLAALHAGLVFERWQERSFTNRFGERIYEEIITLRRRQGEGAVPEPAARALGVQLLTEAHEVHQGAGRQAGAEIESALAGAAAVRPSPALRLRRMPLAG